VNGVASEREASGDASATHLIGQLLNRYLVLDMCCSLIYCTIMHLLLWNNDPC
jgi:hypothetical protein